MKMPFAPRVARFGAEVVKVLHVAFNGMGIARCILCDPYHYCVCLLCVEAGSTSPRARPSVFHVFGANLFGGRRYMNRHLEWASRGRFFCVHGRAADVSVIIIFLSPSACPCA